MTKILTYAGTFKQYLLMDELLANFPEWIVGEGDDRQCLLYLEGNEQGVRLTVPDTADEAAIQAVIDAHDPNVLSVGEQNEVYREDARARFLLSQLADKTPEEIYTLMQNRMDGWSNLGQAKSDLREWLPIIAAVIAWKVID